MRNGRLATKHGALFVGLLAATVCSLGGCDAKKAPPSPGSSPVAPAAPVQPNPEVTRLTAALRGVKDADGARAVLVQLLGEPNRVVGSGLRIEKWDLPGGEVTLHPMRGPTFTLPEGRMIWLLETRNPLRESLLGSYEMTTRPDMENQGTVYWLGILDLREDGTYLFQDSGANLDHREDQENNFFLVNPAGKFEVVYATGLAADTLLESIATERAVAEVSFSSGSEGPIEFYLVSDPEGRTLQLASSYKMPSELDGSWKHWWN